MVTIDIKRHEVHVGNREVRLTPREFKILVALANAKRRVLSREQLADAALGEDFTGDSRTVDVHISRLRKKVGADSIETVLSWGYKSRVAKILA